MLSYEIISKVKQVDIGGNAEKTKQRVREVWSSAEKDQRNAILELANIKKYTVERSYKNGNISAKLASALALVLEIDPYYLAGRTDDPQIFSEELVVAFLKEFGYDELLSNETKKKRSYTKKKKANEQVEENAASFDDEDANEIDPYRSALDMADYLSEVIPEDEMLRFADMTDDDVIFLLKSLSLKARFNDDKKKVLNLIKFILVR